MEREDWGHWAWPEPEQQTYLSDIPLDRLREEIFRREAIEELQAVIQDAKYRIPKDWRRVLSEALEAGSNGN